MIFLGSNRTKYVDKTYKFKIILSVETFLTLHQLFELLKHVDVLCF